MTQIRVKYDLTLVVAPRIFIDERDCTDNVYQCDEAPYTAKSIDCGLYEAEMVGRIWRILENVEMGEHAPDLAAKALSLALEMMQAVCAEEIGSLNIYADQQAVTIRKLRNSQGIANPEDAVPFE